MNLSSKQEKHGYGLRSARSRGLTRTVMALGIVTAFIFPGQALGQTYVPGRTRIAPNRRAQQANSAPQSEKLSVFVQLAPNAPRRPVRTFARNHGGFVKYEYKLLPITLNIRSIPRASLNALAQLGGVVKVEEDRVMHGHLDDSVALIRGLQS